MSDVFSFSMDLRDVVVRLVRLQRLDDRRWPLKGPRKPWSDQPRVRTEDVAALERRVGLVPPVELLALAALEIPMAHDYGLCGIRTMGVEDMLGEQPEWERWNELTALAPFRLLECEVDGGSTLPEIVALGLSGPEDIEAPTWVLALAADGSTYGLIGGRRTKHDRQKVLSRGELAHVLNFAIDAQIHRLPTLAKELATIDSSDLAVPDVLIEPPPEPAPARTVHHPKFGRGLVVGEQGLGDARKLTIAFEGVGEKTLLASFVREA